MNRRTFLRSIATVCGATVVCPGELLKKHKHPGIGKIPPWVLIKGSHDEYIKCYGKHGQHCCCNSCVNYTVHQYSGAEMKKLLNELETAFWNTTFKSPLMPRTK